MKITVSGLTDEEVCETIEKVVKNHRSKAFDLLYSEEDIEQESWLIVLNQLEYFDISKCKDSSLKQSLENWLNTVLSNRLKNLYRDKCAIHHRRYKSDASDHDQQMRINLKHPLAIEDISEEAIKYEEDTSECIEENLLRSFVVHLNDEEKEILDSILSGESVPGYYKSKLLDKMKEIRDEHFKDKS